MHQYINLCPYLTAHICFTPFEQFHENMGAPVWHCVCVCSSQSTSGNTPLLECVHASGHVFMSIWLLVSPQTPMHSYTETRVALCGSVFLSHSPHLCFLNLYGMCTCISTMYLCQPEFWILLPSPMHSDMETWMLLCGTVCFGFIPFLFQDLDQNVYMHQYMYYSLPDSSCLLHSISILTWKDGFLCVALCVSSSHSTSGPTSWIEGVHAAVHVLLSTWLPMSASPH